MMRSAIGPSCFEQVLFTEQQTRSLRPTNALAAAISDRCCPSLEMDIRNRQNFSGSVYKHGHIVMARSL